MYRSRSITALTVFALALSLTFAVSVGTSTAKKKATPKLFKNTTYKPLGCGFEPEPPCAKGKTSSVRNKLSSLTFLVRPLSFDYVAGSDACPEQGNDVFPIGKHSAPVQFDKDGKFSFEQSVIQSGDSMTGSGVKAKVAVIWKVTGKLQSKYGFDVTVKYVSSGPCTISNVPTMRPVPYYSHGEG
jgi:hypothetical protein